jgi:hypothetical protein
MKKRYILFAVFILVNINLTFGGAPPPPPPTPGCWPPPCIPIDGGISLLIAAGAIYGGRKLYKNKKGENSL